MVSDDAAAGSSRRGAGARRYRALRMSATPRMFNLKPGALSLRKPASPLPVVPEPHPIEAPPPPVNPVPQIPVPVLPMAPPPTLTWERSDQAPIARAMGNGSMGRLVVGYLHQVAGVDNITIVCFCHGTPFSPVGFLEHAGAADLSYPLRRIMISYPLGGAGPSGATGNGGSGGQQ